MAVAPSSASVRSTRPVPQNLEAERALLGGMILDNRKIPEIVESVPAQARRIAAAADAASARRRVESEVEPLFSNFANQEIFEIILYLFDRDRGVDLTTIGEELEVRGRYDAVGGPAYLASLEEEIVSTLYISEYVRIVVEKWRLRCLLAAAESIAEDVTRAGDDVAELIDRSEQKIFDIAQQFESKDFVHIGEIAAQVMAEVEARAKHATDQIVGVPSGFTELDKMTTGFRPSNLIIVAARPSVGKSAFVMNIAAEVAIRHHKPVGVFSLEMSAPELNQRVVCTMGGVPLWRMRSNRLSSTDMDRLHGETIKLNTAPLYIDDSSSLSILELRSRARRLKSRCPDLALIIVDYLQLMHVAGMRIESRQQEVTMISRALKSLARDLEVPVIALSQLSRQSEQRGGKTTRDRLPKLSDLRESGAIEQDADLVIFIHREFQSRADQDPSAAMEPELATIRVGKQRNGPVGDIELLFRPEITQFVNIHPNAHSRP